MPLDLTLLMVYGHYGHLPWAQLQVECYTFLKVTSTVRRYSVEYSQLAINCTNGQPVWSITAFDVTSAPAISDGVMTTLNSYDEQVYAYGMGPTKTTVSAPNIGATTATPITITGSVTDISAGAPQTAVASNFPNGLPCVSDASMTQFIESVYMQAARTPQRNRCPSDIRGHRCKTAPQNNRFNNHQRLRRLLIYMETRHNGQLYSLRYIRGNTIILRVHSFNRILRQLPSDDISTDSNTT